ncbi:GNAT family N-acetyltransferase [Candidatus Protochlamydia phocaeensis]|uniref:GNAT family N-acetyltransferase n=1 Tax=Candidatus Protochlamydia phocaeensis TaxID=1414722 RepID=UPI00083918A0|nr:GNAT family N-acetyltransferase [Candidatus Protochlamydia phocaeensis]
MPEIGLTFKKSQPIFDGKYVLMKYQALLAFSAISSLWRPLEKDHYWVVFEAWQDKSIVGLALVKMETALITAQLYSLFVIESCRRQGIGLALFRHLQNNLVQENQIRALGFEYVSGTPEAEAMEKILIHQKWPAPFLYVTRCYFIAEQFCPPWYRTYSHKLPASMEVFSWKDLTDQDRERIKKMFDDSLVPFYLDPFANEEYPLSESTSLGLRYQGELIGWCLTHLVDPRTIRYSNLFILDQFKAVGLGIQLLIESIRRQKLRPELFAYAFFMIRVNLIPPSWQHFVDKKLIPYSFKVERVNWAMQRFFNHLYMRPIRPGS